MLTYTLRSLVAHRSRLLLTAIAIVVGVGAVAGTFVLTDTARAAAERTFTDPGRGVAVVVVAPPQLGNDEDLATRFETGDFPPVPAAAAARVARVDGVAGITAVVSGRARLVGRNGRVVVDERTPQGRSIDGSFAGRVRAGRLPTDPGEVVLDEITVLTERLRVGDRVRVLTYPSPGPKGPSSGGAVQAATVVGVVDGSEAPTRRRRRPPIPPYN